MAKEKRLDMNEELYMKILEYSRKNSVNGRSMGERVLKGIAHMFSKISSLESSQFIEIGEEEKKIINSFQNFGVLSGNNLNDAVNEALNIYISEHKEELKQKISEL